MATYVGLLRAVNVGGTGKLPMRDLVAVCTACGFKNARTYIQSGNVVFDASMVGAMARLALEKALAAKLRRPVDVVVVDAAVLARVLDANPFPDSEGSLVVVYFSTEPVPPGALTGVTGPAGERIVAGRREFYVHFPAGQGRSKLKLPKLPGAQTARNLNTVRKLVEMSRPSGKTR
jgi:uncharacterized protein (DUF1697 family)